MNLADHGILIRLKISFWNGRKHDKGASKQIAEAFKSDPEASKLDKQLVPKKLLKEVQKAANRTRARFNYLTLPWLDDGARIINSDYFNDLKLEILKLKQEFKIEVDTFIAQYAEFVENNAEDRMGDLFNSEDYPSKERIADRFRMALLVFPIPSKNDWRIEDQQLRSEMQESLERSLNEAKEVIKENLEQRIGERIRTLVERLRKTETRFRRQTITALSEAIDLVANQLNIVEDDSITNICQGLAQKLNGVTEDWQVDELRQDADARLQLADSLDESYLQLMGIKVAEEPTVVEETEVLEQTDLAPPAPVVAIKEIVDAPVEIDAQVVNTPVAPTEAIAETTTADLSRFTLPDEEL